MMGPLVQLRRFVAVLFLTHTIVTASTAQQQHDDDDNNNNGPKKHTRKLPHIVLIVMDDLGSYDLGLHGTGIYTPHSDQLARDGLYLQNYYVLPYCSPTRAALLSGRYPLHTGLNNWISAKSTAGLPLEEETLADMLGTKKSYSTHAVGKWHVGHSSWEQTPTFRGFETFFGFYMGGQDYFTHADMGGYKAYDLRYDSQYFCGETCSQIVDERGNYSTHVFTREAIRVIEDYAAVSKEQRQQSEEKDTNEQQQQEEEQENPLFLYLAYQATHCPNEVPDEYVHPRYTNRTDWTDRRKNYAGMLTAADEGIGNVTAALKAAGIWDDTLIIFTTDNGGPTVANCPQGSSNHPKRGGKASVWEGGITGDAFLSGPAMKSILDLPTDTRFPHLFHVVDWLPTLAELVGVVPSGNNSTKGRPLDGVSQLQSLRTNVAAREEIFLGYSFPDTSQGWFGPAIRYRNWKLLQGTSGGPDQFDRKPSGSKKPPIGGDKNSSYMLFDLETDPLEENDVAEQYPKVVEALQYKLRVYQESCVPFQRDDDSSCPFTGVVNTSIGPTWMPWCKRGPTEVDAVS